MPWWAYVIGGAMFVAYGYVAVHYYVRRHYLSPEDREREDREVREELSIW